MSRKTIRLRRINHRNTLSISKIALKLHCVPKFEPDVPPRGGRQISADFEMERFEIGSYDKV